MRVMPMNTQTNHALMTDLYQLTMAQGYLKTGLSDLEACFYVHFRENPFQGGYAVACGLAQLLDFVEGFAFTDEDCAYLATITTPIGEPLFDRDFIESLRSLELKIDIDGVAEGTVVFPYEPIIRVIGPIAQCQLVETAVLNIINYQTLIATKAARICQVARGPVAEFGLRRAQGPAGGLLASRAAFVGGCSSTSNVEAGKVFGLPVSGTHAHSWVMAHPNELEAFRAFVQVFPHNAVLLVDTYDTIGGIGNAIIVAKEMERDGARLTGIRIDSGDLAWLSIKARQLLNEAGLDYVKVVASNDLDEHTIQSLHEQDSRIDMWGVGTKLVTAWNQPALSGVYKLSATRKRGEDRWSPQIKISDQALKTTLPGLLSARRYFDAEGIYTGDMVYDEQMPPKDGLIIDSKDELRRKDLTAFDHVELLEPCIRKGSIVKAPPTVFEAQRNTLASLEHLHPTNKRLLNPHSYPVGLEQSLFRERDRIVRQARAINTTE